MLGEAGVCGQCRMDRLHHVVIWRGRWSRGDVRNDMGRVVVTGLRQMGFVADPGGKLGQTSTDFEVKPRNSAPMLGIEDGASGKTAPEADCCAPFVYIREASAECILRKTITSPHGKTG